MPDRFPRATDLNAVVSVDLAIGTLIGSYEITRALPRRGSGRRYEAKHIVLPRRATIAVLPALDDVGLTISHDALRAARIIDELDHPGIPRLYECGLHDGRRPWVATQLVDGRSLGSALDARISALEAVAIVRDAASVLVLAHAGGLVHGDLNPATIVIVDSPARFPLCIVDWTGAQAVDARPSLPRLPSPHAAAFVAPEQRDGGVLEGRADIYALGMVARALLERGDRAASPPVFTALVRRMTAKQVAERPTAAEVFEHAAWLADQIERDAAVPKVVVDDELVVPPPPFVRPLTSEIAPNISGEIWPRRPTTAS